MIYTSATLPERLKQLRAEHDRSAAYIASKAGVSKPAYLRWEHGENLMSLRSLESVAAVYGLSAGELLMGYEPRKW